jgi:Xaa-Pro aminopeptidase
MTALGRSSSAKPIPFDAACLDALLDDAGIDILIATSKHNVQYLLGGHRSFFFDYMDAIGMSRYLPIFVYPKGRPEHTAYIGTRLEHWERELDKFWPPTVDTSTWVSTDAMRLAIAHIRSLGDGIRTIGTESAFLPADCDAVIRLGLSNCEVVDALFPLERLRARKTPQELRLLRTASEGVVASMLAVFATCAPGDAKRELAERMRRHQVESGLTFEYCLITAGTGLNRAPSDQQLHAGDILSLDSGGNYRGYIGDLCRMGILGEPDAELEDLLSAIEEIQQAARKPIRAGARGGDIFAVGEGLLDRSPHRAYTEFLAHGMGLVSHEAPRLTATGPVPYPGYDADRGLENGMVISIETTMVHPKRGFIKLEDTIAVTDDGYEGLGDSARGWNRAGVGAKSRPAG